jgi:hypothetical protein
MQSLGTEWGRNTVQPDFWVNIAQGKLERLLGDRRVASDTPQILAVYDDVRFQNEADMIRSYGGLIIDVQRPLTKTTSDTTTNHASEQQQIEHDLVLLNDGTEEGLLDLLAEMLPVPPKA